MGKIMIRKFNKLAAVALFAAGLATLPAVSNADVAAPYPGTIEMKTGKAYGALVKNLRDDKCRTRHKHNGVESMTHCIAWDLARQGQLQ